MDWVYLLLSYHGRISRKQYWIGSCVIIVGSILVSLISYNLNNRELSSVADLALLYPDYAVVFKRAHDRDMSIWIPTLSLILGALLSGIGVLDLDGPFERPTPLFWIIAIPTISLAVYLIIDLGFRKGISGPNRFGPDPLERQA
jgi:uncharacterized membrane protein YhaH (DUF805 family)